MKAAMVDIETLSTRHDAAVLSMGLVAFNETEILHSESIRLDMTKLYGHIDPATLKWWDSQPQAARDYSFGGSTSHEAAAGKFKTFIEQWGKDEVWANSPQFDLTILKSWWDHMPTFTHPTHRPGVWPIHYRTHRDCRTMFNEARRLNIKIDSAWKLDSVAHNPVDDAANQARAIIMIRQRLFPAVA